MTEKRFFIGIDKKNGVGLFDGDLRLMYIQFSNIEDATSCENALIHQCNLMNELYEENRELQRHLDVMRSGALTDDKRIKELYDENEQLKQRNDRQAKRLAELYELMAKKDWESLTEIIDDFCSCEEQLQREWRTYE